ncbi:hypothetical protein NE237_000621 [Protea cynaroides]|uniref:Uncharacterized protein n=1 Tax=Protea cynaroides TaxID=273540 RepID=A0A9Q0KRU9_9MAGN|nr:hypothetical protein NE237_000621 [Protea cynaroides]
MFSIDSLLNRFSPSLSSINRFSPWKPQEILETREGEAYEPALTPSSVDSLLESHRFTNMDGSTSHGSSTSQTTAELTHKRGCTRAERTRKRPSTVEIPTINLNSQGQVIGPHYTEFITFLGTIARTPTIVPLNYDDWRSVPMYYKEEAWKEMEAKSEKNKECRKKQKLPHTAGRTSFPQTSHLMSLEMPEGRQPSRVELFEKTHKRKNGSYIDQDSMEVMVRVYFYFYALTCLCAM